MLSSIQGQQQFNELFENILYGFLSETIIYWNFSPTFEEKSFVFSDISLLRLGKNMSIAM